MREGWEKTTLGSICERTVNIKWSNHKGVEFEYIDLSSVSRDNLTIAETTTINSGNAPSRAKKIVHQNDIIFATTRPTLKRATIIDKEYDHQVCSTGYVVLRPTKNIVEASYIYYFILSEDFMQRMGSLQRGASYPAVSDKDVTETPLWLPKSLTEQKQIVAILDQAFAAIDQAKANIEKNIDNAKELLESYKKDLLEKYASGNFVEVKSIVKLTRGHNPPKKDFIYEPKEGYVRFYQIRDGWSDKHIVFVPDTPKLHRVKEDEMLMVAYRHIGKVFRGVNGAFNVALCKITNLDTDTLNNDYLFELIPSLFIRGELLKISERSLIPSMSVKELEKFKVPLPSMEQQVEVVNILKSINQDIGNVLSVYESKLNSLEELKKSILQKAFAGELTGKGAKAYTLVNEPLAMVAEGKEEYGN